MIDKNEVNLENNDKKVDNEENHVNDDKEHNKKVEFNGKNTLILI